MADVVPLATAQANAVHISEFLRTATDVSDVIARLKEKGQGGKQTQPQTQPQEDDDAVPTSSGLDSVDSDGRTAFHWCLALKRFDLAAGLAAKGAGVATTDSDGTTTLTTACSVEAPNEILSLIAARATSENNLWNTADSAGNTPLMYLASRGNVRGLKYVLSTIPPDAVIRFRPVERAEEAKRKQHEAFAAKQATSTQPPATDSRVTELDDDETDNATEKPIPGLAYCDVFVQNNRQQTAIHRAVSKGSQEFVEELIGWVKKRAANDPATSRNFINAADTQGNTALHYASMENNEDMGKLLLRFGASRDAKNKKGQEFWQM